MHTYAVVSARAGRRIPEHVQRILDSPAPADLTFVPADHVRWSDAAGGLQFGGWQTGAENLGVGSRWEVRTSGITAFSGHTWLDTRPWKPGASWAAQLADHLAHEGHDLRTIAPRLDGAFSLVHLGADGRGAITSDPLGVGIVYQGRNEDVTVFSNRAALAARLLAPESTEPRRDAEGAVCVAYANNLQSERTTFSGVTTVPHASVVEVRAGANPRVHTWSHRPWVAAPGADPAEMVGAALDHMRSLVRLMAALPAPILTMELTGGRDSRMVLSLLLAADVAQRFTYVTWGSAQLPDVVVASQLAQRFDLDLRAEGYPRKAIDWRGELVPRPEAASASAAAGGEANGAAGAAASQSGAQAGAQPAPAQSSALAAPPPNSFEAQLRRHVWRTSGAVSVWDLSTISRDPSPAIALTGQFGELMRSNYPRTGGIASLTDLELFVRSDGFRFDAAKLLRPAARRHFDDVVVRLLRAAHPPGGTPQDAVDGYYQLARIRTWFGSSNELDNRNRLYPLYSMPAARAAFAMGSSRRRMEAMPFEVIRANCPELLTMPFASSAWPESLIAGLPDAHRYPTTPDAAPWTAPTRRQRRASRKPFVSGGATAGVSVEQRRMEDIDAKIPVLREFLDLGPGHELYSYLDYDSTMSAVDNLGGMFFSGRRAVHDAVTAAMWLDGAEMPEAL